jgi:hypothetical protein
MHIQLSPVRRDETLSVEVEGDTLILNGEAFDFAPLPAGATLPRAAIASDWFAGDVRRDEAGDLHLALVLPHGAEAPDETLFPAPITAQDGPVPLPPFEKETADAD